MLDNNDIISISVSEKVEKIPAGEKDYRKCSFMCFTLHSHSIQRADQHIANIRNNWKRCNNWHMISFIHCGSEKRIYRFSSGNKFTDARKEMASYIGG